MLSTPGTPGTPDLAVTVAPSAARTPVVSPASSRPPESVTSADDFLNSGRNQAVEGILPIHRAEARSYVYSESHRPAVSRPRSTKAPPRPETLYPLCPARGSPTGLRDSKECAVTDTT